MPGLRLGRILARAGLARILATIALIAALGGCGGDRGSAESDAEGGPARAAYERTIAGYFSEEEPATIAYEAEAEAAESLEEFADVLEAGLDGSDHRFAAFEDEADPPEEVEAIHADLVRTVTEELRLGRAFVAAARAGDEAEIERLDRQNEEVVARFPGLQERFDEAGYEVDLPEP